MEKLVCVIATVFVFTACGVAGEGGFESSKSEFYELKTEGSEEVFYFQYPSNGVVQQEGNSGSITYGGCEVRFGFGSGMVEEEGVEIKVHKKDGRRFEAWFEDDVLFFYSGVLEGNDYLFWSYEDGADVARCIDLVDDAVYSFTDEPLYINEKHSFKVDLLLDYKVEDLPSGDGILMKKWIGDNVCTDEEGNEYTCGYKVEITVFGSENVMGWADMPAYLAEKYPGYSTEFSGEGVFVNEGLGGDAVRHYIFMDDGADIIYEAALRVPSFNYAEHKGTFDELVKTIEIF